MKPIKRQADKHDPIIPSNLFEKNDSQLQKDLKTMFMENWEKGQRSLKDSRTAEEIMQQIRDLNWIEESEKIVQPGVTVTGAIGNGLPNANGDIIDWSGSTAYSGDKITISDNTYTDGDYTTTMDTLYIGDDLNDHLYVGDPLQPDDSGVSPLLLGQPNSLPNSNGIYTLGGSSAQFTGFNFGLNTNEKYAVMKLPREDMPMAVFVSGRLLTMGILGTDVECAYTGDKLVFEPGVVSAITFGNRITMSIEYDTEIYHYNVGSGGQIEYESEKSSTLVVTLVSTIKKQKGTSIAGSK